MFPAWGYYRQSCHEHSRPSLCMDRGFLGGGAVNIRRGIAGSQGGVSLFTKRPNSFAKWCCPFCRRQRCTSGPVPPCHPQHSPFGLHNLRLVAVSWSFPMVLMCVSPVTNEGLSMCVCVTNGLSISGSPPGSPQGLSPRSASWKLSHSGDLGKSRGSLI